MPTTELEFFEAAVNHSFVLGSGKICAPQDRFVTSRAHLVAAAIDKAATLTDQKLLRRYGIDTLLQGGDL